LSQGSRTPGAAQAEAVDALIARLEGEGNDPEAVAALVAQRADAHARAAELARIGDELARAARAVPAADVDRLAVEAIRRLRPLAGVAPPEHPTREQVREVGCKTCGVAAGDYCRSQNGRARKSNHRTRVQAWRDRAWMTAGDEA
jgi:hypothetical protein